TMVDAGAAPVGATSTSSFNLGAHKETAVLALSFLVPPAAIALRQGKVDLESRHLALSLALYLSVVFYAPAVVHAYWLLFVRDNGGVEEWMGARMKQANGLWNEHGGIVKARVDQYSPQVVEKVERARNYTTEKINYATGKKDEAVSYIKEKRAAVHGLYDDAKDAYQSGTAIDWAKEQLQIVVEKVKSMVESYPRVQALVHYVEQRVPLVLEFLGKIYETIRSKLPVASSAEEEVEGESVVEPGRADDSTLTCGDILTGIPRPEEETREEVNSAVTSPRSNGTTDDQYETAEDATLDESFNDGTEEEQYSQEL
ncbi:hypothetical protein PFISCL1PPCAC_13355, partial [Pristionchus fissidentatus]